MAKITEKKYKEIIDYVIDNYKMIPQGNIAIENLALLNRQCHINSYNMCKLRNNYQVVAVVCIDKTRGETCDIPAFVHFINCTEDGAQEMTTYIDISLGYMGKDLYDYYIIDKPFTPQNAIQMYEMLDKVKLDLLCKFYKSKKKCKKLKNCI